MAVEEKIEKLRVILELRNGSSITGDFENITEKDALDHMFSRFNKRDFCFVEVLDLSSPGVKRQEKCNEEIKSGKKKLDVTLRVELI